MIMNPIKKFKFIQQQPKKKAKHFNIIGAHLSMCTCIYKIKLPLHQQPFNLIIFNFKHKTGAQKAPIISPSSLCNWLFRPTKQKATAATASATKTTTATTKHKNNPITKLRHTCCGELINWLNLNGHHIATVTARTWTWARNGNASAKCVTARIENDFDSIGVRKSHKKNQIRKKKK